MTIYSPPEPAPLLALTCLLLVPFSHAAELGQFEAQGDVGQPSHHGSASFDAANGAYLVTGGGANMWSTNDAFHFVWSRVSGDFALQAALQFVAPGGDPHRKACLMVRQALTPDSPYIDVAVHGNGLTSLQFRETSGGPTHEIQARPPAPAGQGADTHATRIGLERQGEVFFMSLPEEPSRVPAAASAQPGTAAQLHPSGAFMRLPLSGPLYVGLAVCAHNDAAHEEARFSGVQLTRKEGTAAEPKPVLHCALEAVPIASGDRRVVFHTLQHLEAPNWSRDGQTLLFNCGGRIYRLPANGGQPELIDTGTATNCNNDHGLSPDGRLLAVSDQSRGGRSMIYVLPSTGGEPRQITGLGPSYWHGWSPDGSTLAYCGQRDGEFDIYTIPVAGGPEKRLTTAKGLDDGPDYTADGKFIYFNSERTGSMQIWRMKPDGADQEQVTDDEFNNWFAHPSPDGQWLVFLSYEKGVTGHPANQAVRLRLMPLAGGLIRELARFFGGQGTINVPSWSPDSRQVAFVSYELLRAK